MEEHKDEQRKHWLWSAHGYSFWLDSKVCMWCLILNLQLLKMMIYQQPALTRSLAIIHFANLNASSDWRSWVWWRLLRVPEVPVSTLCLVRAFSWFCTGVIDLWSIFSCQELWMMIVLNQLMEAIRLRRLTPSLWERDTQFLRIMAL